MEIRKAKDGKKLLPKKLLTTILLLAETFSVVCVAIVIQNFINDIALDENGFAKTATLLGLLIVQCALVFFANKSFNDLGVRSREFVRNYAFKKVTEDDNIVNKFSSGDLLGRLFTDAGDVGERIGQRGVLFVVGVLQTAIVLSLLFFANWRVGLCVAIIYPIYFFIAGLINKKITKTTSEVRASQSKTQHVLLKGLQGLPELVVMDKCGYYIAKYDESLKNTSKRLCRYNKYSSLNITIIDFICTSLPIIAVILCTGIILPQVDSNLLFVYILVGYLVEPLNSLSNLF